MNRADRINLSTSKQQWLQFNRYLEIRFLLCYNRFKAITEMEERSKCFLSDSSERSLNGEGASWIGMNWTVRSTDLATVKQTGPILDDDHGLASV
ncbi:hypothetical protein SAY86_027776 [Trapa natans]|uniref:Uncharacterized protein n=1 Tax=Trapa natans TaxID=22666 RepID=A0AAN7KUL2_TRANT|nr:hypothetical protein SAY86_027776 [Trapa natans]